MLSMTGYGEAEHEADGLRVRVEIRSVNNRHLKLNSRLPDGYNSFESDVERLVKQQVRRGTVQLNVTIRHDASADDYQLNETVVRGYLAQLSKIAETIPNAEALQLGSLLALPGVVADAANSRRDLEQDWPIVKETIVAALAHHHQMRDQEGVAMMADLKSNCDAITDVLNQIEKRAPFVVDGYRQRLLERLNTLLAEHDVTVDATAVIREVGIFADRIDISEEVVRLRSHLEQFDIIMAQEAAAGRKLEFLIQEMLRETNTIGSKANDAEIARHVVDIKTNIERLREMIQNVE